MFEKECKSRKNYKSAKETGVRKKNCKPRKYFRFNCSRKEIQLPIFTDSGLSCFLHLFFNPVGVLPGSIWVGALPASILVGPGGHSLLGPP